MNKSAINGPIIIATGIRDMINIIKFSISITLLRDLKFFNIIKLFSAVNNFKKEKY